MSLQTAMTDSEYASLVTKTKAIIDGLPQRSVLNEKVIDWWIKETIKREGERAPSDLCRPLTDVICAGHLGQVILMLKFQSLILCSG